MFCIALFICSLQFVFLVFESSNHVRCTFSTEKLSLLFVRDQHSFCYYDILYNSEVICYLLLRRILLLVHTIIHFARVPSLNTINSS